MMKKIIIVLLASFLLFSCNNKKVKNDVNNENTIKSNNQIDDKNAKGTINLFDSLTIKSECDLTSYFIYLVDALNFLAENSNLENANNFTLKDKRQATTLINEMLNAADWAQKKELSIPPLKECKNFNNANLLIDELLVDFYKDMYKELIDERVPIVSSTNVVFPKSQRKPWMQKSEEEIVKSLLSKGYNEEQIHDAIRYMRKQKQEEAARQTKENREHYNIYSWSYY